MAHQIETWDDDTTPDITMRISEQLEGSDEATPVDITAKTITVKLWLNGAVARTITNTTIVDGPNGVFKFPRLQSPAIAANKYGVAIKVTQGSDSRTYPSSKFLPTWTVHNVGQAA